MPLANDLLMQARHLAELDGNRPKQANLRKAVSSAYYALFHLLLDESVKVLRPTQSPAGLDSRMKRAFTHGEMKSACKATVLRTLPPALQALVPEGFPDQVKQVATAFIELQEQRHIADYDLSALSNRPDTLALIDKAESAFQVWRAVRARAEAKVFLISLLLETRWSK